MKRITNFIIIFSIISLFNIAPIMSFAQSGLVPCGTGTEEIKNAEGVVTGLKVLEPCGFKHVFILINGVIDFIFKYLVVPIAAIMFAYAGFLMLFSGGNSGKVEKAKGIFMNVAFGLVIAAAAWLIINTVLNIVGFKGDAFGLEKDQGL